MNNLFTRQKIKFTIAIGIALVIIAGLFISLGNKGPKADTLSLATQACELALPTVDITAQDKDGAEQDQDLATFLIKYTGIISTTTMTVNIGVVNSSGSATPEKDYLFSGGDYNSRTRQLSVTFSPLEAKQKVVTIKPIDDNEAETPNPEVVILRILSLPDNRTYKIGENKEATITIYDNDVATPIMRVAATDAMAAEQGRDSGTFTISSSKKVAQNTPVNFQISGTATSGSDYTTITGSAVIPKDQTSVKVTVTPMDDSIKDEPDETVLLTLSTGTGYTVSTTSNTATVTIVDNDGKPIVSISPATGTVAPGASFGLTLTRTGNLTNAVTVLLNTSGSAVHNTDYTLSGATLSQGNPVLTIPAGQSSHLFVLTSKGIVQGQKEAILKIVESSDYKIGTPSESSILLTSNRTSWFGQSWITTLRALMGIASVQAQTPNEQGCLAGKLYYKNHKGQIKQVKEVKDEGITPSKFFAEFQNSDGGSLGFAGRIEITTDSDGFMSFSVKIPPEAQYIYVGSYELFDDLRIGPITGSKTDMKLILNPIKANLPIKGIAELTGEANLPPVAVPNKQYPHLPPVKFSLKAQIPSSSYYFDVDSWPSEQSFSTTEPTLVLKDVSAIKFYGRKNPVIVSPSDNKSYTVLHDPDFTLGIDGLYNEEEGEDGSQRSEYYPVEIDVATVVSATGKVIDRKLEGMEKIQKISCATKAHCAREPFATLRDLLKLPAHATLDVTLIPPKIKQGSYVANLLDKEGAIIRRESMFANKQSPVRSELVFEKVVPSVGYNVINQMPIVACVRYSVPRTVLPDSKGFVRIGNLQTHVRSESLSVPENGQAEARFNSFSDTIDTYPAAIAPSKLKVTKLGFKGRQGQTSENKCKAYVEADYNTDSIAELPTEDPVLPTPEPE